MNGRPGSSCHGFDTHTGTQYCSRERLAGPASRGLDVVQGQGMMYQSPPTLTGDPRTDRALLSLARLLQEIARTAPPSANTAHKTPMATMAQTSTSQHATTVHAWPRPSEEATR